MFAKTESAPELPGDQSGDPADQPHLSRPVTPFERRIDRFEEYKFFVEDTNRLTGRRQTANTAFHGFNAAVLLILGALFSRVGFDDWAIMLVAAPVFLVSIISCLMWHRMIQSYKLLIGWRFARIQEMEQSPEMSGSFRMYTREWEELFKPMQGKETFGFSLLESWLPRLYIALYALLLIGIIGIVAISGL